MFWEEQVWCDTARLNLLVFIAWLRAQVQKH